MTRGPDPSGPTSAPPFFNLIDEPWIPVLRLDGTRCELGIRDTLLQADGIAEIQDGSPLVVAATQRLLVAVLYRALEGPVDERQACAWFREGWPVDRIVAYLENWRERFWLIYPQYPFAQIASFEPKHWRAWTVLAAEHNADNAKVLFDHVDVSRPGGIAPSLAARWLLATQTFSVSAGKSELAHTGTAPSATAIMVMPCGRNLRDSLAFLQVPQNRVVIQQDLPLWEREPESMAALAAGCRRLVDGYADRYTWRARSIRLTMDGQAKVAHVAFASGVDAQAAHQSDPMVAYRNDDKRGRLPVIFRDRGVWRDFDSLLPDVGGCAPQVVSHAIALGRAWPERFPVAVLVAGQSNDKAKIEYWRAERFRLPHALHSERAVRNELHELLAAAEDAQKALWWACSRYARDLLSRGSRDPDKNDVRRFVDQMPVIGAYWSQLEAAFHQVLAAYTEARDPDEIRAGWIAVLRDALLESWGQFAATAGSGDAWALRALVRAERFARDEATALSRQIDALTTDKEPA